MGGQEYTQDFTILEENDAKILKLLKKYDLIESADDPVIIFGRLSIIRELVYPSTEESKGHLFGTLGEPRSLLSKATGLREVVTPRIGKPWSATEFGGKFDLDPIAVPLRRVRVANPPFQDEGKDFFARGCQ